MYMLTNILFFAVLHYGFKAGDFGLRVVAQLWLPSQGKPMVGMLSSTNFDFNLILTFLGLNMWIYPIDACSPETAQGCPVTLWAAHLEAWLPFDRDCCYHSVALPANFVTWTVPELQKGRLSASHTVCDPMKYH